MAVWGHTGQTVCSLLYLSRRVIKASLWICRSLFKAVPILIWGQFVPSVYTDGGRVGRSGIRILRPLLNRQVSSVRPGVSGDPVGGLPVTAVLSRVNL